MIEKVTEKNIKNFLGEKLAVLQFSAEWCGPCRMFKPIIEQLSEVNKEFKFGKVDVDVDKDVAIKFEVTSIPCIILFHEGVEVKRIRGVVPKDKLQKEILNVIYR